MVRLMVQQILSKGLQLEYKGLFIEERQGKLGLGTAYIHGFKWVLNRDYDFIFEMDADFSHDPDDLLRLYSACKNDGIGSSHRLALYQWSQYR